MSASGTVVISHPHGNANVREAALAFAEAGLLREFWTGVAWNPDGTLARLAPARLRRQFERRAVAPALRPYLRLHPWREALRLASRQLGIGSLSRAAALSPNACHEDLDRRVARVLARDGGRHVRVAYAYDHCALESFRVARRHRIACVYDVPIGWWRALETTIHAELDAWPGWRSLAPALDFRTPTYARKDEELALADTVVVPSRFVARTLAAHVPRLPPVRVVPFGAPTALPLAPDELHASDRGPLRLLYVGALDLRKGVPYLLQACEALRGIATLTVVGRGGEGCAPLQRALAQFRRIDSLPHAEILALMRASDAFLFPTLFEGMALVVPEAMSQGCAVITTASSGAEDLIAHGTNGFVVPERSVEAIVRTVEALHADRDRLRAVRVAAQRTCRDWSWERYRRTLREAALGPQAIAA
jgi:glycosyltransferase involved in cell wall biosynthesis